ncbi:MAG: rubrerythrin family protein [Chloroflexi bacterium]|nr:MAG: rubrerythrin family protein [Chloroflexota bacterium]
MATETERWRANLQAEIDGINLYRGLAELEQSPELSAVYLQLAAAEERHAAVWRERLTAAGEQDIPDRPGWRTRTLLALARRFGIGLILPTVRAHEQADSTRYSGQEDAVAAGMDAEERSHARLFRAIGKQSPSGLAGSGLAQLEGRHPAAGGNALRAAVLGANDGLVSNISLVMGVAGADLAARSILITGLAGLLAGSLSMAMGEWLSVQSARELYSHQIAIEREELLAFPEEEEAELALIYQAKGVPVDEARVLAKRLIAEHEPALDTLVREELAIDPGDLGGSAWVAAITSFILFSIGAIIPVLPYFFVSGGIAIALSIGLSAVALFVIGAGITVITGTSAFRSGMRQVLFGVAAAGLTFGIGRLVGTSLG